MGPIEISATGLDVEWRRMEVIAQNLANMNSTRGPDGAPYRALRLVSGPIGDFSTMMNPDELGGVGVTRVDSGDIRLAYEPENPDADGYGYVAYPEIDHAAEMTLLIRTSRAYEANLTAMSIAQQMYARAAEYGRAA